MINDKQQEEISEILKYYNSANAIFELVESVRISKPSYNLDDVVECESEYFLNVFKLYEDGSREAAELLKEVILEALFSNLISLHMREELKAYKAYVSALEAQVEKNYYELGTKNDNK